MQPKRPCRRQTRVVKDPRRSGASETELPACGRRNRRDRLNRNDSMWRKPCPPPNEKRLIQAASLAPKSLTLKIRFAPISLKVLRSCPAKAKGPGRSCFLRFDGKAGLGLLATRLWKSCKDFLQYFPLAPRGRHSIPAPVVVHHRHVVALDSSFEIRPCARPNAL
jgi:hypothetical protein